MVKVVPLRFPAMFMKAFGDPEVYARFTRSALGYDVVVAAVQECHDMPRASGEVFYELVARDQKSRRILEVRHVVAPRFELLVCDRNEWGAFRERIVWLYPVGSSPQKPFTALPWVDLLVDSLDGEVDEWQHSDPMMKRVIATIREDAMSPEEIARMKDETAGGPAGAEPKPAAPARRPRPAGPRTTARRR